MSQQVTSLRLRRTQKLLREALIELIEQRGFDAITVGEITERALVSRATFYRNYHDKYDLVEQIFAEAMQALSNAVSELSTDHPPQIWVRFFDHIAEYERLYRALLGRKGSSWFVLKMRAYLVDLVKAYERLPLWQPAADRPIYPASDDFIPDLVATMVVEAITWWLEQGRPYTTQEMTKRCALLVSAIFKETSTWQ
ncbi:MAG TPA: TetR/AcrR family transcriptional regulator [Gammaproteobacteria bacterium]|jgi:AcrR family transcriptional regulator|nr:TetR/AcrR family transcriptional regulator [Gammaproteobacteria bacterium]